MCRGLQYPPFPPATITSIISISYDMARDMTVHCRMEATLMKRSGFTIMEMVIVVVLIGIIAAIGFPKIRRSLDKVNVRSARAAMSTLAATARAAADQWCWTADVHCVANKAGGCVAP